MPAPLPPVLSRLAAAALLAASAATAHAQVRITEWMYSGSEFVEITNVGSSAIDLSGWSYDDDSRAAGTVSLSAFGTLAAGESAILAEDSAEAFRTLWQLAASVKVIGGNTVNLGRADEINLFDAGGTLADRLTYGDTTLPGTIRTQNISGNPGSLALLAADDSTGWVLSAVGDSYGSVSLGGFIANPGVFTLAVPEPASLALMLAGIAALGAMARRRA